MNPDAYCFFFNLFSFFDQCSKIINFEAPKINIFRFMSLIRPISLNSIKDNV